MVVSGKSLPYWGFFSTFADGPIANFDNSGKVLAVVTPMRSLALFNAGDVASPPFELTKHPLLEFTCNPAPIPGRGSAQKLPPRLPQRIAWTSVEFSPGRNRLG